MGRSVLIRLQAKSPKTSERGFALTEVLVAAAITASVFAVTATGLATSLRLAEETRTRTALLDEARNIAAQLHAGVPQSHILPDTDHWRVVYQALPTDAALRDDAARPVEVTG